MRAKKIPNLEWCSEKSRANGTDTRCPFATVDSCPRYYQSLSLLGEAGSTTIEKKEDNRLLEKWKTTDLWPRTAEYETSISGSEGNPRQFSNFCPEVAFGRFGYFATYLGQYADENHRDVAHSQLSQEEAEPNDPGWSWAGITPQHYTECPFYSVLRHQDVTERHLDAIPELPWWRRHLIEIIVGLIITVIGGLLLKIFGA